MGRIEKGTVMPSIRVNDLNIAYTLQGKGDVILLLHGLSSCKEDWQPQRQALAKYYQVIAPGLRGHGETGKPATGYSIPQFADDVIGLLDARCQQVHMIGLSLGGMITLEFATRYPKRLHSAVIINAAPSVVLDNWQVRRFFWTRLLLIRLFGPAHLGKKIAQHNFPAPTQVGLRQQAEKQFGSNDNAAYYRSIPSAIEFSVSIFFTIT
jgi:pimeloyl-ACP methyl ester carboxylesterase